MKSPTRLELPMMDTVEKIASGMTTKDDADRVARWLLELLALRSEIVRLKEGINEAIRRIEKL